MINDKFRYLLAGLLIFLIILLQPAYLKWLGYDTQQVERPAPHASPNLEKSSSLKPLTSFQGAEAMAKKSTININHIEKSAITIISPLYTATISNLSGGTLEDYLLTDTNNGSYRHLGSFNDDGNFIKNSAVSLIVPNSFNCQPCIGSYLNGEYDLFNMPFSLVSPVSGDTILIDQDKSLSLDYILYDEAGLELIKKTTTFFANNYLSMHEYYINDKQLSYITNLCLILYILCLSYNKSIRRNGKYSN